jgi:DNA-binding HxlR family transcriptional regulator
MTDECEDLCNDPRLAELVRKTLTRIADRWSLLTIEALGEGGEMRFSQLREKLPGVSQKMLTQTLRQLERDGLVTRHVHAVVPPRVDYKLTPSGESLGEAVCGVWEWAIANADKIERARRKFDGRSERAAPALRTAV